MTLTESDAEFLNKLAARTYNSGYSRALSSEIHQRETDKQTTCSNWWKVMPCLIILLFSILVLYLKPDSLNTQFISANQTKPVVDPIQDSTPTSNLDSITSFYTVLGSLGQELKKEHETTQEMIVDPQASFINLHTHLDKVLSAVVALNDKINDLDAKINELGAKFDDKVLGLRQDFTTQLSDLNHTIITTTFDSSSIVVENN